MNQDKINFATSNIDWRESILISSATVQDAINLLEKNSLKLILVVDNSGKLEGTISDGDIRRAILQGKNLLSTLESVVFRTPIIAFQKTPISLILKLMTLHKIREIPIIDERGAPINVYSSIQIADSLSRSNKIVIMAGGRGSRLLPLTENCPKPMIDVAGKPMLERIIENAKQEGFCNFILAINYLGHMIEAYFGDGSKHGVKIGYLKESYPLGTAGALSLMGRCKGAPIVVTNGDVMTDIQYAKILDFHSMHNADATMAVRSYELQNPFGVVHIRGVEITGFEEKPVTKSYINAGVYVLNPEVLDLLKSESPMDMPMFFDILRSHGFATIAYPMHEPWLDVGRPEDLSKAINLYQNESDYLNSFRLNS